MKPPPLRWLLPVLVLVCAFTARAENVAQCFSVHEIVKTEEIRYLVDAVSRCTKVYDAVYVMVSFLDGKGRHLDDGVWATYWCRPGRREVHEFAIPGHALGFERVVIRKITTDWVEALR